MPIETFIHSVRPQGRSRTFLVNLLERLKCGTDDDTLTMERVETPPLSRSRI